MTVLPEDLSYEYPPPWAQNLMSWSGKPKEKLMTTTTKPQREASFDSLILQIYHNDL